MPVTLTDDQISQLTNAFADVQTKHTAHDTTLTALGAANIALASAQAAQQQASAAEQSAAQAESDSETSFGTLFSSLTAPTGSDPSAPTVGSVAEQPAQGGADPTAVADPNATPAAS
jgi:uncharacterized protein YejL (UPF0352 family)